MRLNTWFRYFALTTVLTVAGCNLFNPSGEGDSGGTNLTAEGDEYLRRGQYAKAMAAYDKAIHHDSTNSMAYYGYAKAAVLLYRLDKLGVLNDVQATAKNPDQFAFLQHEDSILTLRLHAAARVRQVLSRLTDRDTLTRWNDYLTDSSAAATDTLYETRRLFMEQYFVKADLDSAGYRKQANFPLTDFRMPYTNIIVDFTAFDLLYTMTRLYDLDQNDTVDSRDALMKKLQFGSSGGFSIDSLSNIADDLENDSGAAENLNALIASMSSGLVGTAQLASLIGGNTSGDTSSGGSQAATSGNIDSVISSLGDAVLFYQFGDKLDNDGDGCIDEEVLDEKDNDGDGFVDEDARVIPDDKPDGVDNNHDGVKDPLTPAFPLPAGTDTLGLEARVGETIYPGRGFVLGFVYAYLDSTYQGDTKERDLGNLSQSTWVKIKKGADSEQMKIRLDAQKDSLLVRRLPNGKLPASLGAKLQNAQNNIGGCWRNIQVED